MDQASFDRLVRLLSAARSRRAALGALVGTVLAGPSWRGATAKPQPRGKHRKKKHETKHENGNTNKHKERGTGKGHRPQTNARAKNQARIEAVRCCSRNTCTPGKGKNLSKCCYQDQDLTGKNFSGANLGSANLSRADATGANFQGANLGKACLVDTILTEATINGSTNLGGAIFCRTTMPDGSENNAGCTRGTRCCPTCDDQHPCETGQVCCDGRCLAGDCCDSGDCGTGQLCCGNTCVAGACCAAADCPNETCQRRRCQDHECAYTPISDDTGPGCQTVCCQDAQDEPVCCDAGVTVCTTGGRCHCASTADCAAGEECCGGACQTLVWANQTTFSGQGSGQFDFPRGVAVSGDGLTAWVADEGHNRVSVWTRPDASSTAWTNQTTFGADGSGASEFSFPFGVAVASDGLAVWAADTANNRVSVWGLICPE